MLGLFNRNKQTDQVTILIVDDEVDLVSTIECRLKWSHCNVITAVNGKEGLQIAAEQKPNLILLDNNMPVMTGKEMLEHLEKDPELKNIPVIMCTALCDPQDIAQATSHGVVDYVTKPFDFADLMEKITNVLKDKNFK